MNATDKARFKRLQSLYEDKLEFERTLRHLESISARAPKDELPAIEKEVTNTFAEYDKHRAKISQLLRTMFGVI